MTNVTARMTLIVGVKGTDARKVVKPGTQIDLDMAEAERLLKIGAVSIGSETAPAVPLPAENQTGKKDAVTGG
jgi:hypothetical protein